MDPKIKAPEDDVHWKAWKKQFPFYKRLFYFIAGYPAMPFAVSEKTWKEWRGRFEEPEYDWKNHTGVQSGGKSPHSN